MDAPVVKIKDLNIMYGSVVAVENFNLEVYKGEIFGLLGPNGAGKSSVMRALTRQVKPEKGDATVFGKTLYQEEELKKLVGMVPQEFSFAHDFTVEENLELFCSLYDLEYRKVGELIKQIEETYLLSHMKNVQAKHLSGGYKRLLNLALSTIHNPKLILLDEPTVGLDPDVREQVWKLIRRLNKEGSTMILTTHYLEEAQALCDRLAIMYKGRILVSDTPSRLLREYGGNTHIELKLIPGVAEGLAKEARKLEGVISVKYSEDLLVLECSPQEIIHIVSEINTFLTRRRIPIKEAMINEPTLGDVFRTVVGREIGVKE